MNAELLDMMDEIKFGILVKHYEEFVRSDIK